MNNSKPPPLTYNRKYFKNSFLPEAATLPLQAVVTARGDNKNDKYDIVIVSTKTAGNHCIVNTGTVTRAEK